MPGRESREGQGGGLRGENSTHDVGALRLEGVGPTDVQVGRVVGLQEADEVETLRLGRERHPVKAGGPGTPDARTGLGPKERVGVGESA